MIAQSVAGRVRRVDKAYQFHLRVAKFIEFRVGVLPVVVAVGLYFVGAHGHNIEVESVEFRNFDIWCKQRSHKGDFITLLYQVVGLQRVENIAHARSAAFHGK